MIRVDWSALARELFLGLMVAAGLYGLYRLAAAVTRGNR
jgi:hypothetical protein